MQTSIVDNSKDYCRVAVNRIKREVSECRIIASNFQVPEATIANAKNNNRNKEREDALDLIAV